MWFGCTPKCTANSAMVRSPLIAATATFALNAALGFFRVRFMSCSRAIRAFYWQGSTLATCLIFGVQLTPIGNARKSLSQERDRWFESGSLQRRVCEPDSFNFDCRLAHGPSQATALPDRCSEPSLSQQVNFAVAVVEA
jgi:hypothetical protein